MPIEIRELVIKAEISDNSENNSAESNRQSSQLNKQQIIQECIDQVLQILKEKEER